jgi:hypothetical protein
MEENKMSDREITGYLAATIENDIDNPANQVMAIGNELPAKPTIKMISIPEDQLQQLIQDCQEYKADIITLVSVFNGLQSLFSGKGGLFSIVPVITKLLNDPAKMAELSAIVPVMDKYIQKPTPNES